MPPKRIQVSGNTKVPDFLKARAKKKPVAENELDKLLNMSNSEMFPYVCFVAVVILLLAYNIVPSLFKYLVEFQYPIEEAKKEEIGAIGKEKRPTVQFFNTGVLDVCQLMFLFLCVESFEVFISELLQAVAKYFLKAPRITQEIFVRTGIYTVFRLMILSTGLGLIPPTIFTTGSLFAGFDLPISRTQKFYLLGQIAFQISVIVNYLLNAPQKSWKPLTLAGNAVGVFASLAAYFSGLYTATTITLVAFDISALLFEFKILLDCFAFQKPESSSGTQLIFPTQIAWIVNRIILVLLLVIGFFVAGESMEIPLFALAGAFAVIGVNAIWYNDVTKKLQTKIETSD